MLLGAHSIEQVVGIANFCSTWTAHQKKPEDQTALVVPLRTLVPWLPCLLQTRPAQHRTLRTFKISRLGVRPAFVHLCLAMHIVMEMRHCLMLHSKE